MLSVMEDRVLPSGVNILKAMQMVDKVWSNLSSSTKNSLERLNSLKITKVVSQLISINLLKAS